MDSGQIIVTAFAGVVALVAGIGTITKFINTYIVEPRIEEDRKYRKLQEQANDLSKETNLRLTDLTKDMQSQGELNSEIIRQLGVSLTYKDKKHTMGYTYLHGRLVRIEEVVFSPSEQRKHEKEDERLFDVDELPKEK